MRRNPKVSDARNEWGNMSLVIRPVYDPVKAGAWGITKVRNSEFKRMTYTEAIELLKKADVKFENNKIEWGMDRCV